MKQIDTNFRLYTVFTHIPNDSLDDYFVVMFLTAIIVILYIHKQPTKHSRTVP